MLAGVLDVAQGFLDEAERRRQRFLAKGDAEELHRYRVGVRRARAALGVAKGLGSGRRLAVCRRKLAAAMRSSNGLRDLDVKCVVFPKITSDLPRSMEAGAEKLLAVIRRERDREAVKVRRVLGGLEVRRVLEGMRGCREAEGRALSEVVRKRVGKLVRRMIMLSNGLREDSAEDEWHGIRIEGKKVRYLLEAYRDIFPKRRAGKVVQRLERLQEALGNLNDNAMQKAFLRDPLWTSRLVSDPRLARCLGGVEVLLDQRGKELRRDAWKVLECFRRDGAELLKGLK